VGMGCVTYALCPKRPRVALQGVGFLAVFFEFIKINVSFNTVFLKVVTIFKQRLYSHKDSAKRHNTNGRCQNKQFMVKYI